MAKRKRKLLSLDDSRHVTKRRKSSIAARSDWSEATLDYDPYETVDVIEPPPVSDIKSDLQLTFPMGRGRTALPHCDGPKLEPFSHRNVNVKFIRRLGTNAQHSNVFEVEIKTKRYALKLFRTCTSGLFPEPFQWLDESARPGPRVMADYFRPFNRECRAYGRINERNLQDRCWRAYGYLRLPPHLRLKLCNITGLPEYYWQVRPFDDRPDKPTTTIPGEVDWPIYGIVKELAPSDAKDVDPKQRRITTMLTDLKMLHKNGVVNTDIAARNYIAGRLTDFSTSFTLPHLWFDRLQPPEAQFPRTFDDAADIDKLRLRKIINDSGVKTKAVLPYSPHRAVAKGTRSLRRELIEMGQEPDPFYELGVNEPDIDELDIDEFDLDELDVDEPGVNEKEPTSSPRCLPS